MYVCNFKTLVVLPKYIILICSMQYKAVIFNWRLLARELEFVFKCMLEKYDTTIVMTKAYSHINYFVYLIFRRRYMNEKER